ncbi:MAG: hypothetical protein CMJ78_13765 [Planctomycetaceae bacterium]|nr:hypothetical protein [Planctomycetaceae bacterium]
MLNDQRKTRRYPVRSERRDALIRVDGITLPAELHDVSAGGFGIQINTDSVPVDDDSKTCMPTFEAGSQFQLRSTDGWHEVKVCHLRAFEATIHLGVERLRDISAPNMSERTRDPQRNRAGWRPENRNALRNGLIATALMLAFIPFALSQLGWSKFDELTGADSALGRKLKKLEANLRGRKAADENKPADLLARRKAREKRAVKRLLGTDEVTWADVAKVLELNQSQSSEILTALGGSITDDASTLSDPEVNTKVFEVLDAHQKARLKTLIAKSTT